jgi:hypothetical protein
LRRAPQHRNLGAGGSLGEGAAFAGTNSSCSASVVGTTGSTTISDKIATLDSYFGYGAYYNPGSQGYTRQVTNAPSTLNAQGYVSLSITPGAAASFIRVIAGNILTVASMTSRILAPGQTIPAYNSTRILAQVSGTLGGTGAYYVSDQRADVCLGQPDKRGLQHLPRHLWLDGDRRRRDVAQPAVEPVRDQREHQRDRCRAQDRVDPINSMRKRSRSICGSPPRQTTSCSSARR